MKTISKESWIRSQVSLGCKTKHLMLNNKYVKTVTSLMNMLFLNLVFTLLVILLEFLLFGCMCDNFLDRASFGTCNVTILNLVFRGCGCNGCFRGQFHIAALCYVKIKYFLIEIFDFKETVTVNDCVFAKVCAINGFSLFQKSSTLNHFPYVISSERNKMFDINSYLSS